MSDARSLREKAREAIRAGALPKLRPDRTWGGPGDGCHCPVCGEPVKRDQSEIEMEFARQKDDSGSANFHMHVSCFSAWESELNRVQSAPDSTTDGSPAPNPDASMSRRLPEATDAGNIAGHGRDGTYKRGPA